MPTCRHRYPGGILGEILGHYPGGLYVGNPEAYTPYWSIYPKLGYIVLGFPVFKLYAGTLLHVRRLAVKVLYYVGVRGSAS